MAAKRQAKGAAALETPPELLRQLASAEDASPPAVLLLHLKHHGLADPASLLLLRRLNVR